MELSRSERIALIEPELRVKPEDSDGWRAVTRDGIELGLLRQVEDGLWRLDLKPEEGAGWRENVSKLETRSPEMAEAWAVHEIANRIAMLDEAEGR